MVKADGDEVEAVLALTGGRGAEAVIDFVGEGDAVARGLAMTANDGYYYIVGYGGKIELPTIDLITSEKTIVGNLVGTYAELVELMALADRGLVRAPHQGIQAQRRQRRAARSAPRPHPRPRRAGSMTSRCEPVRSPPQTWIGDMTNSTADDPPGRSARRRGRHAGAARLIEAIIRNNEAATAQRQRARWRRDRDCIARCATPSARRAERGGSRSRALTARLATLRDEHDRLVAEREWLNASLLEFDAGPRARATTTDRDMHDDQQQHPGLQGRRRAPRASRRIRPIRTERRRPLQGRLLRATRGHSRSDDRRARQGLRDGRAGAHCAKFIAEGKPLTKAAAANADRRSGRFPAPS